MLRSVLGTRMTVGETTDDGRVAVEVRGHSAHVVAAELAGFADQLEVIAPAAVRNHLAHLGTRLTDRYGRGGAHSMPRPPEPIDRPMTQV